MYGWEEVTSGVKVIGCGRMGPVSQASRTGTLLGSCSLHSQMEMETACKWLRPLEPGLIKTVIAGLLITLCVRLNFNDNKIVSQ